ncbi:hypothetical protein HHI36_005169 [Cryptolaemus montrouzieri]|uniref:Uncharacterized protein n=1 Tax=Cryptolaemus montrouzieri TaxID=559131 RepID=A0ABD2NUA3_9CUCU
MLKLKRQESENINDKWKLFINTVVPIIDECFPKKLVNSKGHCSNQHRNDPIVKFCKDQLDTSYVQKEHIPALEDLYRDKRRAYDSALECVHEKIH